MAFPIHTRQHRKQLEIRAKPYFVRISDGLHLGYRKGKSISRWVVRTYQSGNYRLRTLSGVIPDDHQPADGTTILSFQQIVSQIMSEHQKKLSCSFCGKGRREVAKLIAGPGVFICEGCVAMCQLYIDHPADDKKLLVENGQAVLREGKPVFIPLSAAERKQRDVLLAEDGHNG